MRTHLFRPFLVALTFALPLSAADEVYVDASGDFAITTDVAPAGLGAGDTVTWKPGLGGEVTGLTFGTDAFASIQDAVDAVTSGGTVFIAEGTYTEGSQIELGKSVTLQGDGEGVTLLSGADTHRVINLTATGAEEIIINDLSVTNGRVTGEGGGILNGTNTERLVSLTLNRTTVSGNTATQGGGGICNWGFLTLNHSTISGNSAIGGGGGLSHAGAVATANHSNFTGNSTPSGGGAILTGSGIPGAPANTHSITLNFCILSENSVSAANIGIGGAILNYQDCTLVVNHTTISMNTVNGGSFGNGGGIHSSGDLTITGSTFAENSATGLGGAVVNNGGGALSISNSTFSGNSAGGTGSGGGLTSAGTALITHSTFTGNDAANGGGIFRFPNSNPFTLRNCLIAGNQATTGGPDINGAFISEGVNFIGDPSASTRSGTGSEPSFASTGTTLDDLLDPTLADNGGSTFTHALVPGSAAINAGDNEATPPGLLTDQRGAPRILGISVDLGAFEAVPALVTAMTSVNSLIGLPTEISIADLLASVTGGSGLPLTLLYVSPGGNPGSSVDVTEDFLIYNPGPGLTDGDFFLYIVTDGFQTAQGVIMIRPPTDGTATTMQILSVTRSEGDVTLVAVGTPDLTYWIESSENLTTWGPVGNPVVCPEGGIMIFGDPGPLPPSRFYRLVNPQQGNPPD